MVFSSVIFVFLFLPAVIITYFICPARFLFLRNFILLAFSLAFYFYGEPKYIAVMIFSIAANYLFGILIHASRLKGFNGKKWFVLAIAVNLAVLVYFKYLNFFADNINGIFNAGISVGHIVLPVGISFYTFQAISYVFDVYRNTVPVQKNIANVALYIAMFPQLIAGPIVRYETVAAEIKKRTTNLESFSQGVTRFILGFGKKIIIANSMAVVAEHAFNTPAESLPGGVAWVGIIAYSLQIFYDFSGYSDMAVGLGKIFGFHFPENFDFPYISKSITEFWRRWHMSLGTWFRDYVYIPLGGNRVSLPRYALNIFTVWFLTGFWHGASWNFIVWGLYFAVILIAEKYFLLKLLKKTWRPVSHLYAVVLIVAGWVVFRSDNLAYAVKYLAVMFNPGTFAGGGGQVRYWLTEYAFEWLAAIVFAVPVGALVKTLVEKYRENAAVYALKLICVFSVFTLSLIYLINTTFNPFIYFRF